MDTATQNDLTMRYMQISDIPEVMVIDEASFRPPWPERSYRFELNESQVSYMVVLEKQMPREMSPWRRWVQSISGADHSQVMDTVIVAYGGLWKIAEEAHVSTIASHPDHRGHKYGEITLAGMIKRAIALKAGFVVLEVRVSNQVAQKLYLKYGFETHGIKKDYYHHDKEDAYDMRLMLNEETIAHVNQLYATLCQQVPFRNLYSDTLHPRLGR